MLALILFVVVVLALFALGLSVFLGVGFFTAVGMIISGIIGFISAIIGAIV